MCAAPKALGGWAVSACFPNLALWDEQPAPSCGWCNRFGIGLFINNNKVTRLHGRHPESNHAVLPLSPLAVGGDVTGRRHPSQHALRIFGRSPPLAVAHARGDRAAHIRRGGFISENLKLDPSGRVVPKSEATYLCEGHFEGFRRKGIARTTRRAIVVRKHSGGRVATASASPPSELIAAWIAAML